MRGNPPPSREQRKEIARSSTDSVGALCARDFKGVGNQYVSEGKCIVEPRDPQVAGTITARFGASRNNHEECVVYENHPSDSRVKLMGDVCQTVTSSWGTGGGNTPFVQAIALAENTIGRQPQNGGNGDGFTEGGPMYTLNATGVHGVAQPIPLNTMNLLGRDKEDNRRGFGIGNPGDPCPTLTKAHSHGVAAFDTYNHSLSDVNQTIKSPQGGVNESIGTVIAPTLTTNDPSRSPQSSEVTQQVNAVYQASMAVRRLTPVECERLQGFPDNYTDIKPKGKDTPDGPRYKALGNSMAVPVMRWIGERINGSA